MNPWDVHLTWLIAVRKKSPRAQPEALARAGYSLPAGLEVGSPTSTAGRGAKDVTARNKLDPQRTVALVVRGGVGLAQRVQAVLRRTRGCRGETRQLEHHPRTGIQFRHAERQVRPFGGDLVLRARSDVGCPVCGELLAIAAEHDWRPLRCSVTSDSTTTWGNRNGSRCSSSCCGRSCATTRCGTRTRGARTTGSWSTRTR